MLTTEPEARTKWCPWGRDAHVYSTGDTVVANTTTKCVASECMMWRWPNPDEPPTPPTGYCGLAGAGTPLQCQRPRL